MEITIWHRSDPEPGSPAQQAAGQLRRGYQPGDPITRAFDYQVDTEQIDFAPGTVRDILDQAFRCFNGFPSSDAEHDLTRQYRAAGHRSLSVGDVVVIGELAMSCEPYGWTPLSLPSVAEG